MLPVAPGSGGTQAPDLTDPCTGYNTGYTIIKDSTSGRITISAPDAQLSESISITR